MTCYHTTTPDRVASILASGLQPNSPPTWFSIPTPYVMLSPFPWVDLNGPSSVVLEVTDPAIKPEYFEDPDVKGRDGLRWPYPIAPTYVRIWEEWPKHALDGNDARPSR